MKLSNVLLGFALACLTFIGVASTQDFPTRPIRLIVTYAAGGAPDLIARFMGAQVESQIGQPIIIDNRAGGNGVIGTQALARATPDGYTLAQVTPAFVISPTTLRKPPYDIDRDFAPVVNLGIANGYLLLVHPSVPAKTPTELIQYAKSNRVLYGSPGVGNTLHLAAELFNVKAGIEMEHIPFRGGGPALQALIAGTIQAIFVPPAAALASIESGQLRPVGFTGKVRPQELPTVPLIRDVLPEFSIEGSWQAWLAPANTPPSIVEALNREVRRALKISKVRAALMKAGYEPDDRTPAELASFIREEAARYRAAVRAAKLEPE